MLLAKAAVPHMRKAKWGRIVNNTTSYRTMHRVLPYGAAKAAMESMSAVWALQLEGSGITVNVLVPGGPTDTPFIADAAGWPRDKMLRPAIMGPPIRWLMSEAADTVTGRRITAAEWDTSLPPEEAARQGLPRHRLAGIGRQAVLVVSRYTGVTAQGYMLQVSGETCGG